MKNSSDSEATIEPVVLGSWSDLEFDKVSYTFKCLNCADDETLFTFDEIEKKINISQSASIGTYHVEFSLFDDSSSSPIQNEYLIHIKIEELLVEDEPPIVVQEYIHEITVRNEEQKVIVSETEAPSFTLSEINQVGMLTVAFTQRLRIVEDKSKINDEVFELKIVPDETNEQDEIYFNFSWYVTSFESFSMNIQIEFSDVYVISDGLNRDKLVATVKNSTYFFSGDNLQSIIQDTSEEIKVPRMMPNTEFTAVFNNINEAMGGVSNAAMVSNFAVNLLLQGSMSALWGLLHSMQIIAHLPLVNISMPANADAMF